MDNPVNEHVVTDSVTNPGVESAAAEPEKLLTQSQVNKIVQQRTARAAEAARQEIEEKYQRDFAELQKQTSAQNAKSTTSDNNPNVDLDQVYQDVRARLAAEMEKNQAHQLVNQYFSKMEAAKAERADFEEVTKDFEPAAYPYLTQLCAQMDNTADLIYELASNPSKLVTLDALATRSPRHAQAELLKLSKSIDNNKQAKAEADDRYTPAPLSRLQPSKVTGSNGKMSVRDLRSQDWLRG